MDIEQAFEFDDQGPFLLGHIASIELLQGVDALSRNERVQCIILFKLSAVSRLIRPFNLDSNTGLTLFADWNLFVFSLDG